MASAVVLCCGFPQATKSSESIDDRFIRYEKFSHQTLALDGDLPEVLSALDYLPDEQPFVFRTDLNGDGVEEIFVGSPEYRLCGTAGCPYFLLNGSTRKIIGEFFGTVVVSKTFINRYPVIQSISKRDIESTNLQTFAYGEGFYKMVSHALLESKGMAEWSGSLE